MSSFNRLLLALAFLGGSAAVQASDGRPDPARVESGAVGEARGNGWARDMNRSRRANLAGQGMYEAAVYERLWGTYNGLPVNREHLLGRYDVNRTAPVSAALLTTHVQTWS